MDSSTGVTADALRCGFRHRLRAGARNRGQRAGSQSLRSPAAPLALHHLTRNSKVGTDQAVGNTAWHADTGRERLQQGFHVIVCNVRPHLSLRLGAASVLPFLRGIVTPARVQPSCLLSLLLLKTVSERRASARIAVTSKGVAGDASGNLHVAVLLGLLSQGRVAVRVASPVALEAKEDRRSVLPSQHSPPQRSLWADRHLRGCMQAPMSQQPPPKYKPNQNANTLTKTKALMPTAAPVLPASRNPPEVRQGGRHAHHGLGY